MKQTKLYYEQERYKPVMMEIHKSNLILEQGEEKEDRYIVIYEPLEFIVKILRLIDMDNNKKFYSRIRNIEKRLEGLEGKDVSSE